MANPEIKAKKTRAFPDKDEKETAKEPKNPKVPPTTKMAMKGSKCASKRKEMAMKGAATM